MINKHITSDPLINISEFLGTLKLITGRSNKWEHFYRGHANKKWPVLPTIYRKTPGLQFIRNEDKIFREIILRSPNEFINENSAIEKLVKMQHYGVPTRLLDITSNPLIALYFACNDQKNKKQDAAIVVFKIYKDSIKFYDSDMVSMLANLSKMKDEFFIEDHYLSLDIWLNSNEYKYAYDKWQNENPTRYNIYDFLKTFDEYKEFIKHFNESEFAGYLLHEIKNEKPQFLNIMDPRDFDQVIPVKVKQSNSRIIKQNGLFLLFGMKNGRKGTPSIIESENPKNEIIKQQKIHIKASAKIIF